MTKADLVAKVAEAAGLTKKDADKAVCAVFEQRGMHDLHRFALGHSVVNVVL